jgi:phage terminase Nu1 subunit (DNA packaging protein)
MTDAKDLEEVSRLFCVTEKAVRGWIASGMPVLTLGKQGRGNKTSISLEKAVEWYFHENYERLELDRARTRLADEQSRKVALENALRTGELGELSIWQRELEKFFGELRAAFLAFPIKLAPQLDGDVNRRKDTLERAVHELLNALASYASGAGVGEGVPRKDRSVRKRSAATTETDGESVGGSAKTPVKRKQRRARAVAN